MKNLLALAAAAVIVVGAIGYWRGWFEISRTTDPQGHQKINIDVDSPKISSDIEKAKEKLREKLNKDAQNKGVGPQNVAPPPPLQSLQTVSDLDLTDPNSPFALPPDPKRVIPVEYQPSPVPPPLPGTNK